ncbi:arsenate reductase ArsC [Oceanicaulis alexandrii]|uniref:arsenate reductase ArsC n=1 Tax=Oceanicaulis alexandrii TaxID=153233 RepID=UPI0003B4DB1E|nr:arsenate reductase ArsC [Oceanicaulis alexandrii]
MNLLVLCTGNSARSILAEALWESLSGEQLTAYSAGSKPTGSPNAYALSTLRRHGLKAEGLRSKSWSEFEGEDAPEIDVVITVCDSAASEACPIWPGAPVRAHWGLPDPATAPDGPQAEAAFEATFQALKSRIQACLAAGLMTADPKDRLAILCAAHEGASS